MSQDVAALVPAARVHYFAGFGLYDIFHAALQLCERLHPFAHAVPHAVYPFLPQSSCVNPYAGY
jgi:hypothetical protein